MFCENCGQEIVQTGNKPRKFCSDKCRKAHKRSLSGQDATESGQKEKEPVLSGQVSVPEEMVTLTDTFHGHKVSVTVPASWQADKQAAELVKAKIPHYPQEAMEGRYDRDKVADIW